MGRMVVEPGSAPHWLDNYRSGRGWRRPYRGNKNHIKDKQKEEHIEEKIKEVLWKKFENVQEFTDEQKEKVKSTVKFQIDIFSRAILEQASDLVENEMESQIEKYTDSVKESKDTRRLTEMYYKELKEKAIDIALEEYNISDKFDIEKAGKKEIEIYDRVKKGEISPKEAKIILEEPILFENIDERYNEENMRAYNSKRIKNKRVNQVKEKITENISR